ncbi:MAG: methyl-accepting chemotaxis sensory transducer [Proteobacteria bacterium]|nr:methyl-accepting chemotaxis sensory transducer [Pseudomonadota bacterium]
MISLNKSISSKLLFWSCISAAIVIAAIVSFIQVSMIPQLTDKALASQTSALAHSLKGLFNDEAQWTEQALSKADLLDASSNGGKTVATLFVFKGGQYVRAATTLKKEDGSRAIGTALDPGSAAATALAAGSEFSGQVTLFQRLHMASYLPVSFANGTRGAIFVGIDYSSADEMLELAHQMVYVLIGVGLVGIVLLAIGLAYAIRTIVSNRLRAFLAMAQGLASGKGDLTVRLDDSSGDELAHVATAFNVFLGKLHNMFIEFKAEAGQMGSSAHSLGSVVHQTNQQAHSQQDVTSQVAASVEQISVSINEVAGHAAHAKESSQSVKQRTEQGVVDLTSLSVSLNNTQNSIAAVSEMTQSFINDVGKINDLVALVSEIASQTNLLALNAAIEAARAGEQGRGFAVVADEVRKLATRSDQTASSIRENTGHLGEQSDKVSMAMAGSEEALRDCVERMSKVQLSLNEIDALITDVAVGSDEVANMVAEQSAASQDIAQSMESLAISGDSTANQMDIAATIATQLEGVSQTMSTALAGFKTHEHAV